VISTVIFWMFGVWFVDQLAGMTRDDDTQAHAAACCVGGVVEWTTPGLRTHGPFLGCDLIAGADDAREGG
jgi:hypothetical protein